MRVSSTLDGLLGERNEVCVCVCVGGGEEEPHNVDVAFGIWSFAALCLMELKHAGQLHVIKPPPGLCLQTLSS